MLSQNFKRIARLDIEGGGQVTVDGNYCYIGHMDAPYGTSILDVSDPRNPKVIAEIKLEGNESHSHKVRVVHGAQVMITNLERARRGYFRRSRDLVALRTKLTRETGKEPTDGELAEAAGMSAGRVPDMLKAGHIGYDQGGVRFWDISDKANPKLISHLRTGGDGSHRFDCDDSYIYLSSCKDGFSGNMLQIYTIKDPARPEPVSDWWMPGQNIAAGETPPLKGGNYQIHHAMRLGNELWAGCWYAGVRGIDISDISKPTTIAEYDYHPAFPHPTHTVMRVPFKVADRDIVVVMDEEAEHEHGQNHAFLWFFDITDGKGLKPISTFHVNECDTPFARNGGRFGAHQYQEHFSGPMLFATWFSGGLRAIDFSNPFHPKEVGYFIPDPPGNGKNVQSNDVEVDKRGLVYLLDRFHGLDILEFTG